MSLRASFRLEWTVKMRSEFMVLRRAGIAAFAIALLLAFVSPALLALRPVMLVYGFQPIPGFRTTQLWEAFAERFSGSDIADAQGIDVSSDHTFYYLPAADEAHRDVFMSNYALTFEPTTRDIFLYTRRFAAEIAVMKSAFGVEEYDVIGHSMGGLIVRTYAEIGDFRGVQGIDATAGVDIHYDGGMRTLVMLATPNHGTQVALLGEWFSTLSRQLTPGSDFLHALNDERWKGGRLEALNPSVRYVSIAGQTCLGCGLRLDKDACLQACVDEAVAWNGSDLVVMMASAYLPGAENCAAIGFDHVTIHTAASVADAIDVALSGGIPPAVIYAPELLRFASP